MYQIIGFEKNLKNQFILARANTLNLNQKNKIDSFKSLKTNFNGYLSSIQSIETISTLDELKIVTDPKEAKLIIDVMNQESSLDDLNQSRIMRTRPAPPEQESVNLIQQALSFIKKNDPNLFQLLQQTINFIVFAESQRANGGSVSNAIGCIWIAPKSDWTLQDATEVLVHELTHSLLFIDERCYGHYQSYEKLSLPSTWSHSSILGKQRPLD